MGTIVARPRKSGGTAYMAKIILKRHGAVFHRETATFETHRAARAWIRDREAEIARSPQKPAMPLRDAIERYLKETGHRIGKTKDQVLRAILKADIANLPCRDIRPDQIVEYARSMKAGRNPSTVGNYLAHLQGVFALAGPAWGFPLDPATMKSAQIVCRRLGYTSKSSERSRRPTDDEIERLTRYFRGRAKQSMPMDKVILFAIASTRRQEEITRIRWDDLDGDRVLVRDMKHPGQKEGNNIWCDLIPEARAVIDSMPRRAPEIFPYAAETISANFTRACKVLGIDDLRFHDLRHEGVSRLFEQGLTIPQVASVSGHRSWQSLKRYTHIRRKDGGGGRN